MDDKSLEKKSRLLTKAYLLSDGNIISSAQFERFKALEQQQQAEERKSQESKSDAFSGISGDVIEPPYDLDYLVALLERSTEHYRCCKAKADDSTGLDFLIVSVEGEKGKSKETSEDSEESETADHDPQKAAHDLESEEKDLESKKKVQNFFDTAGDDLPFIEVINRVVLDVEAIGSGYLEVSRDENGLVKHTFHVPGKTVRIMTGDRGFVQIVEEKKTYFQLYGQKYHREENGELQFNEFMNCTTGEILQRGDISESADGGSKSTKAFGEPKKEAVDPSLIANEIIQFFKYHPGSPWYGLPDIIPASSAVAGNVSSAVYNISFFDNNAVPQYAIIIKGADLSPELEAHIKEFFSHEIKGKPHRTLILPVPFADVEIILEPLAVDVKDQSFTTYRKDNRDEILRAHGVMPARIGIIDTGQLGSGSGLSQQENYKNTIVEPLQHSLEHKINHLLVRDGLGVKDWTFKFRDLDIRDKTAEINNGLNELGRGVISTNEFRVGVLGMDEIDGGDVYCVLAGGQVILIKDLEKLAMQPQPLAPPSSEGLPAPGSEGSPKEAESEQPRAATPVAEAPPGETKAYDEIESAQRALDDTLRAVERKLESMRESAGVSV